MRWHGNRKSSNVDDRRGTSSPRMGSACGGGLLRLLPFVYRILGFKGTAVVVLCA
ncbi:MAG: putative metalloprotease [Gammaproteobacteria bacterium]|jgi:predicted metalloprotease